MKFLRIVIILALFQGLIACSLLTRESVEEVKFNPDKDFLRNGVNISSEEEEVIGKAVSARILGQHSIADKMTINSYVDSVGQGLVAFSDRPNTFAGYSFVVLDSEEVNAMAAPGGYIFISKGFIKLLKDEDMLAAVIAHEISHVSRKHGLAMIQPKNYANFTEVSGKMVSAIDCSGLSGQLLTAFQGAVNDVFQSLMVAGYAREHETEADADAMTLLSRAGYRSEALPEVLEILAQHSKSANKGGWFSTHPKAEDRLFKVRSNKIGGELTSNALSEQADARRTARAKRFEKALGSIIGK